MLTGRGVTSRPFLGLTATDTGGNAVTLTYGDDVEGIKQYIGRELKIDLHAAQEESLIEAMTAPATWVGKRKTSMETIKDNVAAVYAKQLKIAYDTYKFSAEDAQAYATKHAQKSLDLELENLEFMQPGATTIYQSAAFDNHARNAKYAMASGQGEFDKATYKNMRRQYKGQKGKKKIEG